MSEYTSDKLVDSLKRTASIATSQITFSIDDLVAYLNDELDSTIVPMLIQMNEEFFVTYTDYSISGGTTSFAIPTATIGSRIREVHFVETDSNGNETYTNIPLLTHEQLTTQFDGGNGNVNQYGFYIEGNNIKLFPQSNNWDGETLRVYYYKRPSRLININDCGLISAIDVPSLTITVGTASTDWVVGTQLDGQSTSIPFDLTATGLSITAISGNNITLDSVTGLSVGNYVAKTGFSAIAQIPVDCYPLLVQSAKIQIMESLEDSRMWELAIKKFEQMRTDIMNLMQPRVEGQVKKVVSNNSIYNMSSRTRYR